MSGAVTLAAALNVRGLPAETAARAAAAVARYRAAYGREWLDALFSDFIRSYYPLLTDPAEAAALQRLRNSPDCYDYLIEESK